MSSEIVGVVFLVGIALSTTVGLGLAVVGMGDGISDGVDVVAGSHAFDEDGDGRVDGEKFYIAHQDEPGGVKLEVYAGGELVGSTSGRSFRTGVFVACGSAPVVVDTIGYGGGVKNGAGSFTVDPCRGQGGQDDPEDCGADLCEDPPLREPCETDEPTTVCGGSEP